MELCVAEWHPGVQSCLDRWRYRRLTVSLLSWEPRFDSRHQWRYIFKICKRAFDWSNETHLVSDISRMNSMALAANSSGIIILGGGLAKHHICNANIWVSIHEKLWCLQRSSIIDTLPHSRKASVRMWLSCRHSVFLWKCGTFCRVFTFSVAHWCFQWIINIWFTYFSSLLWWIYCHEK